MCLCIRNYNDFGYLTVLLASCSIILGKALYYNVDFVFADVEILFADVDFLFAVIEILFADVEILFVLEYAPMLHASYYS